MLASEALIAMVQQAMQYIGQTSDIETKIKLIKTLNNVSTGKKILVLNIFEDEEEDDGKDCDSSDDEDDDKRYSLDPSWPQSYRKSMDLYSGVASSSLTRIAILKKTAANPRSDVKSARNHVLLSKLVSYVSR
ncbi:hypothetical protein Tco_0688445 [Tanacetum coccineum]